MPNDLEPGDTAYTGPSALAQGTQQRNEELRKIISAVPDIGDQAAREWTLVKSAFEAGAASVAPQPAQGEAAGNPPIPIRSPDLLLDLQRLVLNYGVITDEYDGQQFRDEVIKRLNQAARELASRDRQQKPAPEAGVTELPPLPKLRILGTSRFGSIFYGYTADDMSEYARAALASKGASTEPVAWLIEHRPAPGVAHWWNGCLPKNRKSHYAEMINDANMAAMFMTKEAAEAARRTLCAFNPWLGVLEQQSLVTEHAWPTPPASKGAAPAVPIQKCAMCGYTGTKTDHIGQCPQCHWDELQPIAAAAPSQDSGATGERQP